MKTIKGAVRTFAVQTALGFEALMNHGISTFPSGRRRLHENKFIIQPKNKTNEDYSKGEKDGQLRFCWPRWVSRCRCRHRKPESEKIAQHHIP